MTKDLILWTALGHAAFDGWNEQTLEAAAKEVGIAPGVLWTYFPYGTKDAAQRFHDLLDQELYHDPENLPERTHEKIRFLILKRLSRLTPYKEGYRRLLSFLMIHPITATKVTANTVSHIWKAAGDQSTDFNYYTKRAILTAVYTSTLLYWLKSDDPEKTEAFLDRRLQEVARIPQLKEKLRLSCPRL